MLSSMLFALITLWWGFFGIFARCFLTALQQCNVFCSKLCWWAALSLSHFIVTVNTLDASVEKKEEKKKKPTRFDISCSSEENVTWHVTVSRQWCPLVQRHCFLWLSSQKVSLNICHCESKWEQLATGKSHPSFVVHCLLLTRCAVSQGRQHHLGSRCHQTNWTPGGVWNTWLWKQLDIWRCLLPLCCVRLAKATSDGRRQVRDVEQGCGWIFQAKQTAGVQTCRFRKRDKESKDTV